MALLFFAASSSKQSINKQLVHYVRTLVDQVDVEILDINDYEMPLYSADREKEHGVPQLAHDFYQKIGSSDGLLISFAEHNASYTAAFKNLYDWTSRIDQKVYQGKPMIMLSASPGPGGAANVLSAAKTSAPYFGGELKATLSVPRFFDNFDTTSGRITNTEIDQELKRLTAILVDCVKS